MCFVYRPIAGEALRKCARCLPIGRGKAAIELDRAIKLLQCFTVAL
jgi:hypothetical protein